SLEVIKFALASNAPVHLAGAAAARGLRPPLAGNGTSGGSRRDCVQLSIGPAWEQVKLAHGTALSFRIVVVLSESSRFSIAPLCSMATNGRVTSQKHAYACLCPKKITPRRPTGRGREG